MKNNLRLLALFMSVGVLFLFTNCQKDDEVTTTTQSSNPTTGIKVSTISFDEFKRDTKAYDEFLNVSKGNMAKRMVVDSDNGFFYNDSEVILIEYDKNKTYTFEMFAKDDKTDIYENLVIFEDENQVTTSHIFGYNLNSTDLANLSTSKQIINLSEKYYVKSKRKEHNSDLYFVGDDGNCYVRTWYHPETDEYTGDEGVYYILRVECPPSLQFTEDGTGGGGGDSGGGDSGGSSGGNGGGAVNIVVVIPVAPGGAVTDPGGVSGGGSSGGNYPDPVITRPFVNLNYKLYRDLFFYNSSVYDWLVDNPEFKTELDKFLNASTLPFQDKQDFAGDLLDFAYQNLNNQELARQLLGFLEEESYSPESLETAINALEDIDSGIVSANILNLIDKECQREIINDVLQVSSPFTNVIQQTFNSTDVVNLQFKNGTIQNGANAYTSYLPYGSPDNYAITIKVNNDYLDTCTDLSMITSVLHEMVHAYLIHLYLQETLLAENDNYDTLVNAFLEFYKDSNQVTYDQLDNEVHNAMYDFIQKMANSIYNYAQSKNMSNVTVDYCIALAWASMQDTQIFGEVLTPEQQTNYSNIGYYEQENTGSKIGNACP